MLAAVLAAVVGWVLTRPEPLALGGDNETLHHPLFVDVLRQLRAGALPIWTVGRWAGAPLVGDPVLGAGYAPNYLGYLLTPFPHRHAIDVAACVHLIVFATGMAWCMRRLGCDADVACAVALLAIASPTFVYVARSWINWWGALAWWPWLLGASIAIAAGGRRVRLAAVALAGQVYAGYPQFALYSGLVAVAVLLLASDKAWRARVVDVLVVVGGGIGLAAPQLLPGLAMADESMRLGPGGAARLAALDAVAIPFAQWGGVVGPAATLAVLPAKIAPVVVVLAGLALIDARRVVRVLAGVGIVAAIAASGPALVMRVLHALPLFGFFAGPFKFIYVAAFAAHVLAGIGLARLGRTSTVTLRVVTAALAAAAMWSAEAAAGIVLLGLPAVPARHLRTAALVAIAIGAIAFLGRSDAIHTPQPFSRDAFTPLLRTSPAQADDHERWIALDESTTLQQTGMNFGALWGLDAVSGVGPLPPWREFEVLGGAERGSAPALVQQVGASRVVVRSGGPLHAQLTAAGYGTANALDGLRVFSVPSPSPRVFLAAAVEHVDAAAAVDAARRGLALDVEHVLVEAEPLGEREVGDGNGRVEIEHASGADYRLRVEVARPTWLVVRAAYYRNWRATIDGRAADVRPAGAMFLAVRVDAGAHHVALAYREPGLVPGLVVAALTGLVLVAIRRRGD